jgi:hypothetical protein
MGRLFTNLPIIEIITLGVAETEAWVDQVVTNGGTVSAGRQSVVQTLIGGLIGDGVWDKLDRLWLFAAEDQPSAKTDLVGLTLATGVNSPTFSADDGYTGNLSTMYLDTNYIPSTHGVSFIQNSNHQSGWVTVNDGSTGFQMVCATQSGGFATRYELYNNTGGAWTSFINSLGRNFTTFGSATGHLIATRTDSSNCAVYGNGGSSDTGTGASTSTPTVSSYVLARNDDGGSASTHGAHQIAAISLGGGLTSTDAANFYTRMRAYMTAVGVP